MSHCNSSTCARSSNYDTDIRRCGCPCDICAGEQIAFPTYDAQLAVGEQALAAAGPTPKLKLAAGANVLVGLGLWAMLGLLASSSVTAKATGATDYAIFGGLGLYYLWLATGIWKEQASAVNRALRANVLVLVLTLVHLGWMYSRLQAFGAIGMMLFSAIARIRAPLVVLHALAAGLAFAAKSDVDESYL